eukprot:EG_transcript_880
MWFVVWLLLFYPPTPLAAVGLVLDVVGSGLAYGLYTAAGMAFSLSQPNISLNYVGLGSPKGICRIQNITRKCAATDRAAPTVVDFATAEALVLTAQDYLDYPDIQMYPAAASAIVPIFNLGAVANVTFSTALLAQIFRGEVLFWDDWRIQALNPDFAQWRVPPRQCIKLAVRGDVAGATQVFRRALAAADPAFSAQIGGSSSPDWPNVTALKHPSNQALVSYVMATPFTLGYADLGSARANNLPVPLLQKGVNTTVAASVSSIEYALLELGLSFGNNQDDPSHLTADLVNAAGLKAWPMVGYNYVLMHKDSLRPGATCDSVRATLHFWRWFWTSDVAKLIAVDESYCLLPEVVRAFVWSRFIGDIKCEGQLVWQADAVVPVPGRGTGLLAGFLGPVLRTYNAQNPALAVTYTPDSTAGAFPDLDLLDAAFGASSQPGIPAPPDGVRLVFAGVGLLVVSQMNVTLSGEVLARILDGSVTTWLDDSLVALNPRGIFNASGGMLQDRTLQIQLLSGPIATSATTQRLMAGYLPTYTGAAIRAVPPASSETVLRSLVAAHPLALAVTPMGGVVPNGVSTAYWRRADGTVVAPSWRAISACATGDTFSPTDAEFRLAHSTAPGCYPLAEAVYIRVRRSQCDPTRDVTRTRAAQFVTWLFQDPAVPNALQTAALAPLLDATPAAWLANQYALAIISCDPVLLAHSSNVPYGLIIGIASGVGVAALAGAGALVWWQRRSRRNNAAAPKDSDQPFCILFTDIESSTHLWATAPAAMACALETHHTLIRQLIAEHQLYEVKTIGDSFMCATCDPRRALAFAVALQGRFFAHRWGHGPAIDAAYDQRSREAGPGPSSAVGTGIIVGTEAQPWNGLRVRVGLHYGLGDIKLDPVSRGYDYYGTVVNTAARIESVCHGGQVGVSQAVRDAVGPDFPGVVWTDLGLQLLRGLAQPLHLHQVLPAGPLARRTFPPLRLEWAQDADEEVADDRKSSNAVVSITSGTTAFPGFSPDHHPLVRRGDLTAAELQQQYVAVTATLLTLLATQTSKFAESTLRTICSRLKVKYFGSTGARQAQTVHGLVLRLLPGTAAAISAARRSSVASPLLSAPTTRFLHSPVIHSVSTSSQPAHANQISPE